MTEDGTHETIRPDGAIAPRRLVGSLGIVNMLPHSIRWELVVPGIKGREVEEVLELVYSRLSDVVLPTAESFFAPPISPAAASGSQ